MHNVNIKPFGTQPLFAIVGYEEIVEEKEEEERPKLMTTFKNLPSYPSMDSSSYVLYKIHLTQGKMEYTIKRRFKSFLHVRLLILQALKDTDSGRLAKNLSFPNKTTIPFANKKILAEKRMLGLNNFLNACRDICWVHSGVDKILSCFLSQHFGFEEGSDRFFETSNEMVKSFENIIPANTVFYDTNNESPTLFKGTPIISQEPRQPIKSIVPLNKDKKKSSVRNDSMLIFLQDEISKGSSLYRPSFSPTFASSTVYIEGILLKKGGWKGGRKNWKKRYFVCKDRCLFYYKESKEILLGVIMLDDGFVKEAKYETIKPDSKKGYEFSVLTTERHIYLQAETDRERFYWVTALKKCIANISVQVKRPLELSEVIDDEKAEKENDDDDDEDERWDKIEKSMKVESKRESLTEKYLTVTANQENDTPPPPVYNIISWSEEEKTLNKSLNKEEMITTYTNVDEDDDDDAGDADEDEEWIEDEEEEEDEEEKNVKLVVKKQNSPLLEYKALNNESLSTEGENFMIKFADLIFVEAIAHKQTGELFRGTWLETDVLIHKVKYNNDINLTLLKNEIRNLCILKHLNLLECIGLCITDKDIMIVSQWFSGSSLFDILHNSNIHLNSRMMCKIAKQIAQAMLYLHAQKNPIVHKDLSCHNILVSSDLTIKIANYGPACIKENTFNIKVLKEYESLDLTNVNINTDVLKYIAPELLDGKIHKGTEIDIYSYGIILIEIFSREKPFSHLNGLEFIDAVLNKGSIPLFPSWLRGTKYNSMKCLAEIQDVRSLGIIKNLQVLILLCLDREVGARPDFGQILSVLSSFYVLGDKEMICNADIPRILYSLNDTDKEIISSVATEIGFLCNYLHNPYDKKFLASEMSIKLYPHFIKNLGAIFTEFAIYLRNLILGDFPYSILGKACCSLQSCLGVLDEINNYDMLAFVFDEIEKTSEQLILVLQNFLNNENIEIGIFHLDALKNVIIRSISFKEQFALRNKTEILIDELLRGKAIKSLNDTKMSPDQNAVYEYLCELKLQKYFALFISEGYDKMIAIKKMDVDDLVQLGINDREEQNLLLTSSSIGSPRKISTNSPSHSLRGSLSSPIQTRTRSKAAISKT